MYSFIGYRLLVWALFGVFTLFAGCERSRFHVGQQLYTEKGELFGTVVEVGEHSFVTMKDVRSIKVRRVNGEEIWQAEEVTEAHAPLASPAAKATP